MEQEITIINLAEKINFFFRYCWKNKLLIFIIPIAIASAGYFYAKSLKPKYMASITFMVKEDESNSGLSGIFSVLGSLGIGGGNKSKFNLDKVVALSKSENIIRKALLDTTQIDNGNVLLADYIIRKYELLDVWKKKQGLISQFDRFNRLDSFNIVENTALKSLYDLICNENGKEKLLDSKYDEDNTVFTLSVTSLSDTLSYELVNSIFKHLQDFYIFQVTHKTRLTIKNLESRITFVENKLNHKEYALARNRDNTLGIWLSEDIVPQQQLGRDVQINSVMYGELIKNLETAKFTLQNITPIFQVIDEPYYPIKEISYSSVKYASYWFLISLIVVIGTLFLKFIYKTHK